jgi:NAD(P)-dependent dehydrogenase (short-subunit alcohol dehydrogenase family)
MPARSTGPHAAIVTGAGRGLGRAVAELLLARGGAVSFVDIDGECLTDVVPADERAHAIVADLSRTSECERVVAEAVERWGKVDVLVNCAAIVNRVDFLSFDEATFERIMNTNLRSVFWMCRGVIPGMEERGWGRIVNVTSVGIHTGGYSQTSAIYECTKGAIHNLTKTLARSLAPNGILVNSVAPGGMKTRMILDETPAAVLDEFVRDIPLRRLAEPAEVAEMVAFLASELNTYASGASFDVNGGVSMA